MLFSTPELSAHDPEAVAIRDARHHVTYGQLAEAIDTLAGELQRAGLEPQDRVTVHAPKSIGTITALLAVLRAGGIYVPISPDTPPQRVDLLMKDAAPKFVLRPRGTEAGEAAFTCRITRQATGETWSCGTFVSAEVKSIRQAQEPRAPAYALFTSGSTGSPKGVVATIAGLHAFVDWAADLAALSPMDTVVNVTRYNFDLSIFDIFSTLKRGAALIVADDTVVANPTLLLDTVEKHKATVIYTVPWTLMQWLKSKPELSRKCRSLRSVLFAGEVFPMEPLRQLTELLPTVEWHNLYGPTETNVCTFYTLPRPLPPGMTEVPIGWPASDAKIFLLDDTGAPVVGTELGEVHVEGPTVMRGYLRNGVVVDIPSRYATGDYAYRRADGALMYKGRRDTMRKVHGLRIDVLEIERVIGEYPGIEECAVDIVNDALTVFARSSIPALAPLALRQHVARSLPAYMVPKRALFLPALPRTSNGKIDRQKLVADAAHLTPNSTTTQEAR